MTNYRVNMKEVLALSRSLRNVRRDPGDNLLRASSYILRSCDCGNIHIDLYDQAGAVFATATFDPDNAPPMAAKLIEFHHYFETKKGAVTKQ